ncbi:hypothetical protein SGUI_0308 [Serinicoccus hydrothermalis]|uniref:Uncharacterized protein n=1 Tax=Serinicoccus hydrothermalis TaxID=1758689 RepID=A0A1B1N8G4_9MICO|nr:hypothetical protein SGUI_0308 [Serinicoccus hydrothermalis]
MRRAHPGTDRLPWTSCMSRTVGHGAAVSDRDKPHPGILVPWVSRGVPTPTGL